MPIEYTFRLQEAQWDFGTGVQVGTLHLVGVQTVLCFHQYIDATGLIVTPPDSAGGTWEPFIPGPVIRGNVGDTIHVTIQNRISDPSSHFVEALKTETLIHWHGLELANTFDGTPVAQKPFSTGTDFTYKFKVLRPGMFWYHPHWDSMIQTPLGAYGPIICEEAITDELRTLKVIPHAERTFNITLADVSFQDARGVEGSAGVNHVPVANIVITPPPIYIRNIMHLSSAGAENFGDVHLINGKYAIPFNHPDGNFQQFWHLGQRTNTSPAITVNENESLAFYIANSGLHRFYKVHLAFKIGSGAWTRSDKLYRIGGEGGLLEQARNDGGEFIDTLPNNVFIIRGRKDREVGGGADGLGTGPTVVQSDRELALGEFLIPTSSRTLVAFAVEPGWTEVALRINGFSVATNTGTPPADEEPTDRIIAIFNVGTTVLPNYILNTNIDATTLLLTNPLLTSPTPLPDLNLVTPVLSFAGCNVSPNTLADNDVIVPPGPILTDYDLTLSSGPSINGVSASWTNHGPEQPTFNNTRYVQKGDTVEWTVETLTNGADHPWHMHGFSFQPIKMELNDGAGGYTTLYTWDFVEYLDSIYIPFSHKLTYRFVVEDRPYIGEDDIEYPNGVIGRWLGHCHIFKHAHKGMMMNFFVVDSCAMANFQNVDVYLRDNVLDDGTEPSTGQICYSPDIILLKSTVVDGQVSFGQGSGTEASNTQGSEGEFGQDNFIYVRVNNRGSRLGKVKTDVYWSEPSTLITPDQWNYIGETNEVIVPPGVLTVADPLTWPSADVPATGHYCFIGITGSETDTKTLSPTQVAAFTTAYTWTQFHELIRNNNNVTWRNFNIVNLNAFVAGTALDVKFRGAFDRARVFDIVVENPFNNLDFVIPNERDFRDQLNLKKQKYTVRGDDLIIELSAQRQLTLSNIKLEKSKDYRSKFIIKDDPKKLEGKTIDVIQLFVNDYEKEIGAINKKINRKTRELKEAEQLEQLNQVKKLTQQIEALEKEKRHFEALANNPEEAQRIEVGRVAWHFKYEKIDETGCLPRWLYGFLHFFRKIFSS